jgi:hypothetical protein
MENKIKKCLKSYLTAKKYYQTDTDKSIDYFKQCIKILNDLKDNSSIKDDMIDIIDETETACSKYLTLAIESTLEKPMQLYTIGNTSTNELFEVVDTGCLKKLKEYKYGQVNFNVYNESGLTPLHWAIRCGDTTFLKEAFKLGAHIDTSSKFGHTLLEFACLEKDPNMINFLISNGSDMRKHLIFREGKIYFNNGNQIDILLLEKYVMEHSSTTLENKLLYLGWLTLPGQAIELEYCDLTNSTISKSTITVVNFIQHLDNLLCKLNEEHRNTYLMIIKEELSYSLVFKLGCPVNPIEILLYNLVPFINYTESLKLRWLLSQEVKYIILKILKNKTKIRTHELKKELLETLYSTYIKPEITQNGMMQTIVSQWICKINV